MARYIAPLPIEAIMTRRPRTVGPRTSVDTLQHLFASHGFNAFPVVDDADTLCGIVTKLDLLRVFGPDPDRLLPALNVLWAERVADIMRRRVITLAPDDLVATAVDHMLSMKLRSLPVVERRDGKAFVVGMVSRGDVINALVLQTNTPP